MPVRGHSADPCAAASSGKEAGGAPVRLILPAGIAGGLLVAILDLAITTGTHPLGFPRDLASYAVIVGVLAGFGGALAIVPLRWLGRSLARSLSPSWWRLAPVWLALVALFIFLNQDLFQGAWVRAQWWAGWAQAVWLSMGSVLVMLAVCLVPILLRQRWWWRFLLSLVLILGASAAAWINLRAFGAYPKVRLQLSLLALGAMGLAASLLRTSLPGRRRSVLTVLVLLTLGAWGLACYQRTLPEIHRVRAGILGRPLPLLSHLLPMVEEVFFSPVVSLPTLLPEAIASDRELDPDYDRAGLEQALDQHLPGRRRLNLIWIAVDALRADHVGIHGYAAHPTTPHLDALARRSIWFTRTISPIPASAMGYSCCLTGLFARVTPAYAAEFGVEFPVPSGFSLPAVLAQAGWRTRAVTAFFESVVHRPNFRTHQEGFQLFNPGARLGELRADEVTDRALELLETEKGAEDPFFLWVHYMEPHAPYHFHPEFDFGRAPVDAYDSEIAFADAQVGRLLEGLSRLGLMDQTAVVLFGDHGEGFGEHNNREHGASLHDHQVWVPLVMALPGLPPRRVDLWVGLQDLVPTMTSLLGVEDPYRRLGRNLMPLALGLPGRWPDVTYAERAASASKRPRSWERAVWSGDLKLIWKPHHQTTQVFDLSRDREELHDLYDSSDPEHQRLFALLRGVDQRIDAYWGEASRVSASGSAPAPGELRQLVVALRGAPEEEAAAILRSIHELFISPAVDWDRDQSGGLDSQALTDLRTHLMERIPPLPPTSPVRSEGLAVLAFLSDDSLLPFFQAEMDRTASGAVRLVLIRRRAEAGDREVVPLLEAILDRGPVGFRMEAAEGLAHLGSDRGLRYLRLALDHPSPRVVRSGVRGLAALGKEAALWRLIFSFQDTWEHPWIEREALRFAQRTSSPVRIQALLRLMGSVDRITAGRAAQALEQILAPAGLLRAREVAEAMQGARNALLYHDPNLARHFLEGRGEEDDPLMGPWWWVLARTAWEAGDLDQARRALDRLEAACAGEEPVQELVRRARRALDHPPMPPFEQIHLAAQLAGEPVLPLVSSRQLFFTSVSLQNLSGRYLPGGEWPGQPRLLWRFVDEQGRPSGGSAAPACDLPLDGLLPGESRQFDVLGQFPPGPGTYRAELVLTRDPGNDAATLVLLEIPPLEVR